MASTQAPAARRDRFPGSDDARERRLFRRYQRLGDLAARDELYRRHADLAAHVARRFRRDEDGFEDLVQVARLGLIKAIERFDVERGLRFTSFAVPTIAGELKRHLRDTCWAVHVPRDLHDLAVRLERARARLERELGRAPTPAELAAAADTTLEQALEALGALTARRAASLEQPPAGEPDDGPRAWAAARVAVEDAELPRAEHRALLAPLIRTLSARERELVRLRFEEDLTQAEIGQRLGVSQMHVSRLLRQTLARMESEARLTRAGHG